VVIDNMPLRWLTAPVRVGTVEMAAPLDEYYEMLDDLQWGAAIASPFLLLAACAGGYWMSGRALRPVREITRAAERIEARNLSDRLPLSGTGDELDRLSATLNGMFGRLEESFRRVTQFTADASHELRTPVAVIRATAEVARGKPRSEPEYAQALDRILAESERITRLIEDLMLLARADAGADGISLAPMDLARVVEEACREARVLAEAAGLRLTLAGTAAAAVRGDEHALHRLTAILLDNAVKYTPRGGEVTVRLRAEAGMAVVEVRDTGIGIAGEDLPHIFERFYRASKDRSRATGGTGLGLAIARWIAERHAGEIAVESRPGAGSVFALRIPLDASAAS
jgi:heavy metal sensor kinase